MTFTAFGCRVRVSPLFTFAVTAVLIIDTTGIYRYVLLATVLHELGHIAALMLTGNRPAKLNLEPFCIRLIPKSAHLSVLKGNIVAFGGAAANIAACGLVLGGAAFTGKISPSVSAISAANAALAVFNLLPLDGLDGGDISSSVIRSLFNAERAKKIEKAVSGAVKAGLCFAGAGVFLYNRNPALLLFGIYLAVNSGICSALCAHREGKRKKHKGRFFYG